MLNAECLMPISIGQKVHEGEKFIATLKLVDRSFAKCTILIDDTVQRHTLAIAEKEKTPSELYNDALKYGDQWLNTYQGYIASEFHIPYKIIRWDKWLYHKDFEENVQAVRNCYNKNKQYKESIDENIREFLKRRPEDDIFDWEYAKECCLEYLIEECAAMCLWVEEKCEYELYPSGRNKAMAATYETLIKPRTPNLLRSVALRFKKYGKKIINEHIEA